jgi:hypothetical protein
MRLKPKKELKNGTQKEHVPIPSQPSFPSRGALVPSLPFMVCQTNPNALFVSFPVRSCRGYPYNNPRPDHSFLLIRLSPCTRTPAPVYSLCPCWSRLSSAISSPSWWRSRPQPLQPSDSSLVASLGTPPRPLRRSSLPPSHPVFSQSG